MNIEERYDEIISALKARGYVLRKDCREDALSAYREAATKESEPLSAKRMGLEAFANVVENHVKRRPWFPWELINARDA